MVRCSFLRSIAWLALCAAAAGGANAQSVVWSKSLYGSAGGAASLGNGELITRAIAMDASGNAIVTGSATNGANLDFLTTKLGASNGAVVWQASFNDAANRDDVAMSVAADGSGNAIVVGHSFDAGGSTDIKVIKYAAADGAVVWQKSFDGGSSDFGYAVAIDAGGNAIVGGESFNGANYDVKILKFAAADGTLLWQRSIDGGADDFISDIALDAAGNVLGAGVSGNSAGNDDWRIFKLAGASGAVVWNQGYDGGAKDQAYGIAVDSAGNAIVTGYSTAGANPNVKTVKYSAGAGTLLWQRTLDNATGNDWGQAIAVDASGNAIVTSQVANAAGGYDFRTVKYAAADGATIWDKTYDSGANDFAYQVAVDAAGNATVAGSSSGGGGFDWRVLQYAPDGALRWQYAYNGSGNGTDNAFGLAVRGGAICVAGSSTESGKPLSLRVARLTGGGAGGGPGASGRAAADFNGDGRGDLLWQGADGSTVLATMSGASQLGTRTLIGPGTGWSAKAAGDFNGDGKADIVWQHTDGTASMWLMDGTTQAGGARLIGPGTGWSVRAAGDFDGDGKADLVWQHTDGTASVWLMDGTTQKGGARLLGAGSGWSARAAGDFNGDGKADILWQHTDGTASMWLMDGTRQIGGTRLIGAGTGWQVQQAGDFDGDGKADIVWQRTDGAAALWLMNGTAQAGGANLLGANTGWSLRHVGDLDGDGRADIVWQHTDGRVALWLMNGAASTSAVPLSPPAGGYSVAKLSP